MKSDIKSCKTEFTLDEVARLWAGVETETPENRENVLSAMRILLRAIRTFRLSVNGPDSIADVPLRTETGDYNCDSPWRSVFVTRQALKEWFALEKWSLLPWLTSEAIPSAPPPNQSGHSQEALLRIIVGLVVLLTEKSGSTYKPCVKPRGKLNKASLHEAILSALECIEAKPRGIGRSQFYDIFNEDFCSEIIEALYPEG